MRIVGILLAAGAGTRFGGAKLLVPLRQGTVDTAAGTPLGVAACRHVVAALPETIAVVRPGDTELTEALAREGARTVACARADDGMGASLACGVRASADAEGWVVALADMPWIRSTTIRSVAVALANGADIAAPFVDGQRGHPVGFSRAHRDALLAAHRQAIRAIEVDDRGVTRDVDREADLGLPPA